MMSAKAAVRSRLAVWCCLSLATVAVLRLTATTAGAASVAAPMVMHVTVERSCRISTDAAGLLAQSLGASCVGGAPPQVNLEPSPMANPPQPSAAGLIARAGLGTGVPGPPPAPVTLRLTIDF